MTVVALVLLALGFVNVARGVHHHRDYRDWALHNGSYSDVVALSGDRYLHGDHPVPYIDDRIEYPVVLGFVIWLPSFAPGGHMGYVAVTALLLAAALLWALRSLSRLPGTNPWLFAATPAIALYGILNWDLIGIALTLAAVAALERERRSGVWLGLGAATKLFPIALVPAYLRAVRRPVVWLATASAVVLVINVPFMAVAFDNWSWFFRFSSKRPPDFAIWNALQVTSVRLINVASLGMIGVAALFALRRCVSPLTARFGLALIVAVWMTTNKVSSPQYSLWIFACAALVAAPWPLFAALVVASTFDFVCELWLYPHHAIALTPTVTVMVIVRTLAVGAFAAWCAWRLRVEVALDEGAQRGGGLEGEGSRLADGLDLARG